VIRRMLLIGAAVAMPLGFIAATAGTAGAAKVIDNTGTATANCTTNGGTLTLKVGIGLTGGSYVFPTKNKGNQFKIAGIGLTCTSSAVSGSFTGTASGKIKTTSTAPISSFYSCTGLVGVSPMAGGTLSGSLKIKWAVPAGQKFGGGPKSVINVTSVAGSALGTFTIPGNPGTGSVSDSFAGTDAGASSMSVTNLPGLASLATQCTSAGGLTTIPLGTGTATLQ
jgi:hypothetical protein